MNVQIFGKTKCFGSRAAERFFKERKVKYQFVNILDKGLSARELDNILQSVKDIDLLFDSKSSTYESLNVAYIKRNIDDKKSLLLANPSLLAAPIVRDCDSRKWTIGIAETIWKSWFSK